MYKFICEFSVFPDFLRRLLVGICFLMSVQAVQAQTEFQEHRFESDIKKATYLLTGKISDIDSGDPLSGVSVHIDGFFTGINSDLNGQYVVALDSGRHRIVFRRFGKTASHHIVYLYGDGKLDVSVGNLDFELEAFTLLAEERDRNVRSPITGVTKMTIKELRLVPTLMGEPDVFNVLQSMPGVTSVGEGSAGINVRGGQADQNLILLNEALVLSNSHALGFLSAFNGDVLQNFTLYKGAAPSSFGGRSASVLNIESRKGDLENWKYSGSLGTALSKIVIEGPIIPEKTSMLAAVRRSNANWLLNSVDELDVSNSSIRFHDIYLGLNHRFSEKNTLDLTLLNTGDFFRFSDQFGFQWSNFVGSLTSKNLITENFSLIGMAAYGTFENAFFEPAGIDPARISNGLSYIQGKFSGLYTFDNFELTFGGEAISYQMAPERLEPFNISSEVQSDELNKQRGIELAPFISSEWNPHTNFSISAGLRYSMYQQLGPDSVFLYQENRPLSPFTVTDQIGYGDEPIVAYGGFEPRVSVRWTFNEVNSIKAGYSTMNQYLQTISNATGPTPIDLWQLSTTYIKPQRSYNYSLGYFRNFKDNEWSTSLEGYFRKTDNQLEYRDFANLFLNPNLEAELIQGEGQAYGAELLIQRNTGGVTGWLSYTYSRSFIRTTSEFSEILVNGGNWFPTNFDRPHILSLVTNFHLGKARTFNVNVNYSTGRPVTAPSTNYIIDGIFLPDFGDRNQFRIPNYFRIDLSYLTNGIVRTWDDKFNFSIYNVLGRRNAYSVFFQREAQSLRLRPYQLSILGSVFPTISYSVAFTK